MLMVWYLKNRAYKSQFWYVVMCAYVYVCKFINRKLSDIKYSDTFSLLSAEMFQSTWT